MNKQKKLLLERSIFLFIISIAFTFIIISEKKEVIFLPKAQKKFNDYLESNYSSMKNTITVSAPELKKDNFIVKITSKENKHHFFYLYYANHKVTDTYQKDYVEGNQLLHYIEKKLQKEIKNKTNLTCTIKTTSSLNKYTQLIKERIIKEDNLLDLKFYTIEKEIMIDNWTPQEITNKINNSINSFTKYNITPKNYSITITNNNDISQSIRIENITNVFSNNPQNTQIINDIINDNNSNIIKQNKITYQYLN